MVSGPERGRRGRRRFAFALVALLTIVAWAAPVISFGALPGTLSASADTLLGGLNLDQYCADLGYDHSSVLTPDGSNIGPNAAYKWACIAAAGSNLPSPYRISQVFDDMYLPCEAQYPNQNAVPVLGDPNDAYTWNCAAGSSGPPGGLISGRVCISSEVDCPSGGATIGGIDGAPVTACATNVSTSSGTVPVFCSYTITHGGGYYTLGNLPAGLFALTADPPPGIAASSDQIQNITVGTSSNLTENFSLPVLPVPSTSGIEGSFGTPSSPTIDSTWSSYTFDTYGCPGGTFTYSLTLNTKVTTKTTTIPAGKVLASGQMTQVSSIGGIAHFQAVHGQPLSPAHGKATLLFSFTCPGGVTGTSGNLPIYIDPSGTVVNQKGDPISGATVTLYYSPIDATGPYSVVADGSTQMSPGNRTNPTVTGTDGSFGWDVLPGFYKVVATRDGCTGPTLDQSPALSIPPAVTGITLKLHCTDTKAPRTFISSGPDRLTGATTARFVFGAKKPDGSSNVTFECKLDDGVFTPCDSPQTYSGLTDGAHTFTVHATDTAGNTSNDENYRWMVRHDKDRHERGD